MSKNIIFGAHDAKKITILAPADVLSGALVISGKFVGIAVHSALSGAAVTIERCVVASLAKEGTDTFAQGAVMYWNATNSTLTSTASTNALVGHSHKAVVSGDATAEVVLIPHLA